jgi:hypothetical protein
MQESIIKREKLHCKHSRVWVFAGGVYVYLDDTLMLN